jgi:hypothetical protein
MGHNVRRHNMTLGDLVVAVTEEALEVANDEKKAYQLAEVVVNRILGAAAGESCRRRFSLSEERRLH